MNSRRRDLAQLRVAPADQRLGADDGVAVPGRPAAGSAGGSAARPAPGASHGPAACASAGRRRGCGWWKRKPRGRLAWRACIARFGVAQQLVAVVAVGRVQRDADAAGQRELRCPRTRTARAERVEHARAPRLRRRAVSAWCTSSANWSPPRRASGSPWRRQVLQALGHLDQHAVAGVVAEGVVDLLEAVEVEQQQREAARRRAAHAPARGPARRPAGAGSAGRSARRW